MVYRWFLRLLTYLENSFYTDFITFVELFKDHFARPPARKFALLFKCYFPIFLIHEHFLIVFVYLVDFLLLFPRTAKGLVQPFENNLSTTVVLLVGIGQWD